MESIETRSDSHSRRDGHPEETAQPSSRRTADDDERLLLRLFGPECLHGSCGMQEMAIPHHIHLYLTDDNFFIAPRHSIGD